MSRRACQRCLARSWLLGRLAGHLDTERARITELLELDDEELIDAVGGRHRSILARELRERRASAARRLDGTESICRCDDRYPSRLRDLSVPPAVLHVVGGVSRFIASAEEDPVAIVGSRRPSGYGIEVARSLGRELAGAGITVLSGLAQGIDAAAHDGALDAGRTVAVLPGPADRPYPREKRGLYRAIVERGAAVSELAGEASLRRWMFPARNRVIAGLAAMTVVVEASDASGALLTAGAARDLGRPLGAVPGRITSRQATGPNGLLADGAHVVRGAQDVLDALFGAGMRTTGSDSRPQLSPQQRRLLSAIADGGDLSDAFAAVGMDADRGLAEIAALELDGYVRRGPGGRFDAVP